MNERLKIKKLRESAILPARGSAYAAGFDLCANNIPNGEFASFDESNCCCVPPHTTIMVGTGIAVEIPKGFFGAVFARSGIAAKKGLRPSNCVGVIDSDYRGEIIVSLHNDSNEYQRFDKGDRIAQLVIIPYATPILEMVDKLGETGRGSGGFGSTGL